MDSLTDDSLFLQKRNHIEKGLQLPGGKVFFPGTQRVGCGQMGKNAVYGQTFHFVYCGNFLRMLTADPLTVHACVHGNVDVKRKAAALQRQGVRVIQYGLDQLVLLQQGKVLGSGITQDQNFSGDPCFPQVDSLLNAGYAECVHTQTV